MELKKNYFFSFFTVLMLNIIRTILFIDIKELASMSQNLKLLIYDIIIFIIYFLALILENQINFFSILIIVFIGCTQFAIFYSYWRIRIIRIIDLKVYFKLIS